MYHASDTYIVSVARPGYISSHASSHQSRNESALSCRTQRQWHYPPAGSSFPSPTKIGGSELGWVDAVTPGFKGENQIQGTLDKAFGSVNEAG